MGGPGDWLAGRAACPQAARIRKGNGTVYLWQSFYAAADAFEKSLPAVEGAKRAVVILLLRGYDDIGSTVMRYCAATHKPCKARRQTDSGRRFPCIARPAPAHRDA